MRSIGLLALAGAIVMSTSAAQADELRRPGTVSRIDSTLQNAVASLGLPPRDATIVADVLEAGLQVYRAHGFEAKAAYGLSAGTAYLNQSATLRLAWHF